MILGGWEKMVTPLTQTSGKTVTQTEYPNEPHCHRGRGLLTTGTLPVSRLGSSYSYVPPWCRDHRPHHYRDDGLRVCGEDNITIILHSVLLNTSSVSSTLTLLSTRVSISSKPQSQLKWKDIDESIMDFVPVRVTPKPKSRFLHLIEWDHYRSHRLYT